MGTSLYSRVSYILGFTGHFADTLSAGRLRAACDLVSHHLPPDMKTELMSAYEYVSPLLTFH